MTVVKTSSIGTALVGLLLPRLPARALLVLGLPPTPQELDHDRGEQVAALRRPRSSVDRASCRRRRRTRWLGAPWPRPRRGRGPTTPARAPPTPATPARTAGRRLRPADRRPRPRRRRGLGRRERSTAPRRATAGGRTRSTGLVVISPRFTASSMIERNVARVSATVLADKRAEQLGLPRRDLLGPKAADPHIAESRDDPLDPILVLPQRRRPHPDAATVCQPPRAPTRRRSIRRSATVVAGDGGAASQRRVNASARRRSASSRVRPRTRRGRLSPGTR